MKQIDIYNEQSWLTLEKLLKEYIYRRFHTCSKYGKMFENQSKRAFLEYAGKMYLQIVNLEDRKHFCPCKKCIEKASILAEWELKFREQKFCSPLNDFWFCPAAKESLLRNNELDLEEYRKKIENKPGVIC